MALAPENNAWFWYVGRNQKYRLLSIYKGTAFIVGDINDKAFCVRFNDLTRCQSDDNENKKVRRLAEC